MADAGQYSGVVLQLEITPPLVACGRELDQVRGKEPFGIQPHGAQFPHADCTAGFASADLIEERRTRADDFDPKRGRHEDGSSRDSEYGCERKIHRPLQPAIEWYEQVLS